VEFRLRVLVGKNAGYELPIPAPKFLIGGLKIVNFDRKRSHQPSSLPLVD